MSKVKKVDYHRQPTAAEIKFGEGATHYLTVFERHARKANGDLKKWLLNPYDQSDKCRYYY